MTILNKICAALGVSYGDIIEYVPQEENVAAQGEV
jgi:DNA-binding Xre family transcriptional regulator